MKNTLLKLLNAHGASGRETAVGQAVREMVRDYADEVRTDRMGNVIALKHGKKPAIMIAAHMDHIGFVVTDADENGFLRVSNVGAIRKNFSLNRRVVFENGVSGIISHEEEHFDANDQNMQSLYLDIGAASREEALKTVSLGDMAVYAPDTFELLNDRIAAPAMDDRVGCAIGVEALKRLGKCENEIAFVFTVQEEVGLRGAQAAAYGVDPEIAIALDVTLTGDTPKGTKVAMGLGKGVAIKVMDGASISAPELVRRMRTLAEEHSITWQDEVLPGAAGTDAGGIQRSRAGVMVITLSIPCRYVHSACETVDMKDVEATCALLTAFLQDPGM